MRKLVLCLFFTLTVTAAFSQKDKRKLSDKEAQDVLNQIKMDSTTFLKSSGTQACGCIDSVNKVVTDKDKKIKGFSDCIDEQVNSYQLATKLLKAMKSNNKNNQI